MLSTKAEQIDMDLPDKKTPYEEDNPLLKSLDQRIEALRKRLNMTPGSHPLSPEDQDRFETEFRNNTRMRKTPPQQTDN